MSIKTAAVAVFFIILLAFTAYLYLNSPNYPTETIEEMTVNLSFIGSVEVAPDGDDPRIDWLVVETLNFPEEGEWQEVLDYGVSEPHVFKTDHWGNRYLELNFSDPVFGTNTYRVWAVVRSRKRPDAGEAKLLPEYEEPSEHIQSEDEEIRKAAASIVQTAERDRETVSQVTQWVHENVEYNLDYEGSIKDALSVLRERQGVCVEYSHLEEALLRSLGIPARHIYGAAPYEDGSLWREHSWVEAYINGTWVPLDPTWGQTEFLDAAHIKLAVVPDHSHVQEKVSTVGIDLNLLSVKQPEMKVEVLEIEREDSIFAWLMGYI